jgi:hypothetical protein
MGSLLNIGKKAGEALSGSLFTAAGQLLYGSASGTAAVSNTPTGGQLAAYDGSAVAWTSVPIPTVAPTGAFYESMSRLLPVNVGTFLTSTTLQMTAIPLLKGQTVTSVTFVSGTTALSAGSNQWAALFDGSRNKVAISADDTSTAWGANTAKTFTMTTPYTATATGTYYVGLMVKATTVPTLLGNNSASTVLSALAPILNGTSDTALSNPASCPSTAAAITATAKVPYFYLS